MTSEAKRILKILPDLIREDTAFRLRLWEVLSGDFATKGDIGLVLREMEVSRKEADRRFEATERRFEMMDKRFEAIDKRFEAMDKRFEAMDKRFETMETRFQALLTETREGFQRIETRFEAYQTDTRERFQTIETRFEALVVEMHEGFQNQQDWVGIVVGGFQNRAGRRLEDAVAGTLRIALKMRNVDPDKIRLRQKINDPTGKIGPAGRSYEVDILATNGDAWIFEVKSTADEEDVERFNDKAEFAIAMLPLPGAKKALITLDRSRDVAAACQRLGILLA